MKDLTINSLTAVVDKKSVRKVPGAQLLMGLNLDGTIRPTKIISIDVRT